MQSRLAPRAASLVVALIVITLTGGALTSCAPRTAIHSAAASAASLATVTGTLLQYGGPIGADGSQPTPRAITAIAAIYRRSAGEAAVSGTPVTKTFTSPTGDGKFELEVGPGDYFIIAENPDGTALTAAKPISVSSGSTEVVDLQVIVP